MYLEEEAVSKTPERREKIGKLAMVLDRPGLFRGSKLHSVARDKSILFQSTFDCLFMQVTWI